MKPFETDIATIIRSRAFAWFLVIIAALMLWSGAGFGLHADAPVNSPVAGMTRIIIGNGTLTAAAASLALLMCGGIMALTDSTFSILRSPSRLDVGLFSLLACATPFALGFELTGAILCVTVLLCLMIMYTTYARVNATRRVFLVFCLLSAGSVLQYGFAIFLPAMLIGCWQMRCFSMRSVLAAVFGMVTPYWILWGFGIIRLDELVLPQISLPSLQVILSYSGPQLMAVFTALTTAIVAMVYNLIKVFGRNARTRALNGILASLTFWTAAAVIVDFGHALIFMPLLCAFAAMQTTLYFITARLRRAYLPVSALILIYIAVYVWNLLV